MADALPGVASDTAPAPINPEWLAVQSGLRIRQPSPLPGAEINPYDVAQGAEAVPATTIEVLRATMESTLHTDPTPELYRMTSREARIQYSAEGRGDPLLNPDELNRRYGVEWQGKQVLTFDRAMPEDIAAELRDTKIEELRREFVLSRDPGGNGLAKFGIGLLFSAVDPLNLAAGLVPVVGEARYAKMLYNASSTFGRAGVRLGVGALEGAVGTAAIEPIVYAGAQQEQADYDLTDSFLNVTFGSILGGGLHVALGGFHGAVESRMREMRAQGAVSERMASVAEAGATVRPEPPRAGTMSDLVDRAPIENKEIAMRSAVAEMVSDGQLTRTGEVVDSLGMADTRIVSDTNEFRTWFGDSKVVDDTGSPIVVYHGTSGVEIKNFAGGEDHAGYFSDKPEVANRFAEGVGSSYGEARSDVVYPVYIKMEKPNIIDANGEKAGNIQFGPKRNDFIAALHDPKADGVIIRNTSDEGNIYIPKSAEQIRSAVGSRASENIGPAVYGRGTEEGDSFPSDTSGNRAAIREGGEPADARAALDEAETLIAGLDKLGGLSEQDRAILEGADGAIKDAEARGKAIDIALSCALRG